MSILDRRFTSSTPSSESLEDVDDGMLPSLKIRNHPFPDGLQVIASRPPLSRPERRPSTHQPSTTEIGSIRTR